VVCQVTASLSRERPRRADRARPTAICSRRPTSFRSGVDGLRAPTVMTSVPSAAFTQSASRRGWARRTRAIGDRARPDGRGRRAWMASAAERHPDDAAWRPAIAEILAGSGS
jgi:hypothetical protein